MTRFRQRGRDERGVIAILFTVFALLIFVMAALVVDLGQARDVDRQTQNAADAAALAAANQLYLTGTVDLSAGTAAAKAYAQSNLGVADSAWNSCTDPAPLPVASGTNCITYDSATKPTQVRVYIPTQTVSTGFARVFGVTSTSVHGMAQAYVSPGGTAVCGLCVIGTGPHDIQNGDITINGASAFFNGTLDVSKNGSVVVTGPATTIKVEGSVNNKGTISPAPLTGQQPIQDPLAFLPLPPSFVGLASKAGSACTGGPGIYFTTFQFTSCTLTPGLYVLAGSSADHYSGQTAVKAPGVTFYFTCMTASPKAVRACNSNGGSGEAGGGVLMTGQASLTMSAPDAPSATQGLAMVSDRNNNQTFGFRGNGTDPTSGTIYAAIGTFDYRGNGNGPAIDSLVVVNDLTFSGNPAAFSSLYTKEKNQGLPPQPPDLVK